VLSRTIPPAQTKAIHVYGAKAVIDGALASARSFIDSKSSIVNIGNENGLLWPLFFSANPTHVDQYEIDTCATALGFAATLGLEGGNNPSPQEFITQSLITLISLRRPDGSWPSIQVRPEAGPQAEMEGVVNDTIYALHALVDGGYLEGPQSSRQPNFPESMKKHRIFATRVTWLKSTILWIQKNRLNRGWYYTSTEFMADKTQYQPAVGPTASMVLILDRLAGELNSFSFSEETTILVSLRDEAIAWLREVQHESGGYGRDSRDLPRVPHTSIALIALTTANSNDADLSIMRATDWLLSHANSRQLNKLDDSDSFDEYSQAIVFDSKTFRKRIISHEHPIEPLVLRALCSAIHQQGVSSLGKLGRRARLSARIFTYIGLVIRRQEKDGALRGGYLSRRSLERERYPVYWLYHTTIALTQARRLLVDGKISKIRNIVNSLSVRIGLVLVAGVAYASFVKNDVSQILSITLLGVAANVVSFYFTRE